MGDGVNVVERLGEWATAGCVGNGWVSRWVGAMQSLNHMWVSWGLGDVSGLVGG